MKNRKQLVLIGLGNMGVALTRRLIDCGYTVHGYDHDEETRTKAAGLGILVHEKIEDAITAQMGTKVLWIMVPASNVDDVIASVRSKLTDGDVIIDGGNSFFKDSIHRHHDLASDNIDFLDCGVSGDVSDTNHGVALMIGGEKITIERHNELFADLASEHGFAHVGAAGAGHFAKMVHNAIEYGMIGAIAEGVNLLHEHRDGLQLDIQATLEPYRNGSIIESNLIDWLAEAYATDGYIEKIAGEVPKEATEMDMEYLVEHENVQLLEAALRQRKLSRMYPSFTGRLISAMRQQFGGATIVRNTILPRDGGKKSDS